MLPPLWALVLSAPALPVLGFASAAPWASAPRPTAWTTTTMMIASSESPMLSPFTKGVKEALQATHPNGAADRVVDCFLRSTAGEARIPCRLVTFIPAPRSTLSLVRSRLSRARPAAPAASLTRPHAGRDGPAPCPSRGGPPWQALERAVAPRSSSAHDDDDNGAAFDGGAHPLLTQTAHTYVDGLAVRCFHDVRGDDRVGGGGGGGGGGIAWARALEAGAVPALLKMANHRDATALPLRLQIGSRAGHR